MQHSFPTGNASVGSFYRFRAYLRTADGAYDDVTAKAVWLSSDPSILRLDTPGLFTATSTGAADVLARYNGLAGSLSMFVVRADRQTYPRLALTIGSFIRIGSTSQATARLEQSSTSSTTVTEAAVWTSSNPDVATISRGGLITPVAPGTTLVTATYDQYSGWLAVSVAPRDR